MSYEDDKLGSKKQNESKLGWKTISNPSKNVLIGQQLTIGQHIIFQQQLTPIAETFKQQHVMIQQQLSPIAEAFRQQHVMIQQQLSPIAEAFRQQHMMIQQLSPIAEAFRQQQVMIQQQLSLLAEGFAQQKVSIHAVNLNPMIEQWKLIKAQLASNILPSMSPLTSTSVIDYLSDSLSETITCLEESVETLGDTDEVVAVKDNIRELGSLAKATVIETKDEVNTQNAGRHSNSNDTLMKVIALLSLFLALIQTIASVYGVITQKEDTETQKLINDILIEMRHIETEIQQNQPIE